LSIQAGGVLPPPIGAGISKSPRELAGRTTSRGGSETGFVSAGFDSDIYFDSFGLAGTIGFVWDFPLARRETVAFGSCHGGFGFFSASIEAGIRESLLERKDLFENTGFNRSRVTTGIEEYAAPFRGSKSRRLSRPSPVLRVAGARSKQFPGSD
jgi:hypothetical protein